MASTSPFDGDRWGSNPCGSTKKEVIMVALGDIRGHWENGLEVLIEIPNDEWCFFCDTD